MTHNPLYIIPARGGSKGIPGKNIKHLGGVHLIAYTVACARAAGVSDDRIILSTDSEEIATVVRNVGLKVDYMRPAHLATDTAGSQELILDVMSWADARNLSYDSIVLLQPTSPFRLPEDILGAQELYTPAADLVVSVCPSAANPYFNLFETDDQGFLRVSKGGGEYKRRQDCPQVWEYNGAVYVFNPESVRAKSFGEFTHRIPYKMPAERSVDLDTPADWLVAEALLDSISLPHIK